MPARLISRQTVGYLVRWSRFVSAFNEGDLLQGLVQSCVFQSSTEGADLKALVEGGASAPGLRAISIYALSQSLGQPRETVRRKVKALLALGRLVEVAGGVRIPDGHLATDRSSVALTELAVFTRDFVRALTAAGLPTRDAPAPAGLALCRAVLARTTNQYCLRLVDELNRLSDGDVMTPLVFSALSAANIAHLPLDPRGTYAHFDVPVPERERRPVTILALSDHLGMPRETTRRYVNKIAADGGFKRIKGGYISVEGPFQTDEVRQVRARVANLTRRFVVELPVSILDVVAGGA